MALVRAIYFRTPQAALLTIRGYSFQFDRELTAETDALVNQAVGMVLNWIRKES